MIVKIMNKKTMPATWLTENNVVYIGRPSPLGNPFIIGKDGTRDEVIAKYSKWLYHNAQTDHRIRSALDAILQLSKTNEVIHLVCWCAPYPCHGDVISMWLREHEKDN
jgi:hypothetical protein